MIDDPLRETLDLVSAAPHSAAGLTLYALVCTLEQEQAGCLFKLTKLRDLSPEARRIAFALMEMMAEGRNRGATWQATKTRLDELVRAG